MKVYLAYVGIWCCYQLLHSFLAHLEPKHVFSPNRDSLSLKDPLLISLKHFSNGGLLFFCILGIFSIATFNITGVTVTKYINALARSIGDVTRTILVWGIGIIITVTAGATYPNYKWELLNGGAIALELLGFVILVSGNLVYNQIIKIPGITERNTREND